jgi:Phage integrase, N-terminal SAM-like domain
MTNGTIERKCMKGHKKAEGRCSPRCVRWYPRIQRATPDGHSRRRFDYLGGYPTKAAARAALHQALGRQGDNVAPDHPSKSSNTSSVMGGPAQPTLNDLLDHWLAHLQANKAVRLRTVGRYRQLTEHHVRPYLGALPLSALSTLQVQRLYDQLAHHGRKDGKAGGLGSRTIRQLHLCLHQALSYAMKWPDLATNPAADAEPPALPAHTPAALTPSRSASCSPPPTMNGGRGCTPLWSWRRQPAPAPASCAAWNSTTSTLRLAPCGSARRCPASTSNSRAAGRAQWKAWQAAGRRPPQDARQPGRVESARLRGGRAARPPAAATPAHAPAAAAGPARPGPRPVELDLLLRTGRGTAVRPEHASQAFRAFAQAVRGPGASPPATPFAGLGDGGGQGTRQRDRRAAAPRRRRHAGQ